MTRDDWTDLEARIEQLREGMAAGDERLGELSRRVDRLVLQVQQRESTRSTPPTTYPDAAPSTDPGAVPPPSRSGAATALPDPDALYNTAYADFSKGNYALAVSGLRGVCDERFPDEPARRQRAVLDRRVPLQPGRLRRSDRGLRPAARDVSQRATRRRRRTSRRDWPTWSRTTSRQAIVQLRYVVSEYPQHRRGEGRPGQAHEPRRADLTES